MKTRRTVNRLERTALAVALLVAPAAAQEIKRVSVDSSGAQADYDSFSAAISGDGNVVAFESYASNLVAGDVNWEGDIFVHDRSTGITELVSVSSHGVQGDGGSHNPAIARDGTIVAFESRSSNLVPFGAGSVDVYVRDRVSGVTERVSVSSNGSAGNDDSGSAAITADGNIVAFQSFASNLVFSDSNNAGDVFVHDRTRGVTELVSVTTARGQGNSGSVEPAISADGNLVVFRSYATNLVAGDANGKEDVFIRDRAAKTVRRMSVSTTGAEADQDCFAPAISADGSVVAYCSAAATLVAGDTNGKVDVFIRDRTSGTTERVSVDSSGLQGDGDCSGPALSSDGRLVAFGSASTNLVAGDTNARPDVFLHDRTTGTTTLVTINRALDPGNNASNDTPSLCDDGSVVAFASLASNLVIGDTNRSDDVFADDLTVPPLIASWNNYGAGYPGTLGVPTLTSSADPVFGTSISIDASNSSGIWSEGVVVLGLSSSSIPTSAGGELLVDPFLYLLLPLLPGGGSIDAIVPRDMELCGLSVYMQVLELDAGAAHGISFTPGLQLAFGQ